VNERKDFFNLATDCEVIRNSVFDWVPIVAKYAIIVRENVSRNRSYVSHDVGTSVPHFGEVPSHLDLLASALHSRNLGHVAVVNYIQRIRNEMHVSSLCERCSVGVAHKSRLKIEHFCSKGFVCFEQSVGIPRQVLSTVAFACKEQIATDHLRVLLEKIGQEIYKFICGVVHIIQIRVAP